MFDKKPVALEIVKEIDLQKQKLEQLIDAGRPMTDPNVMRVSQSLDECLNKFYQIYQQDELLNCYSPYATAATVSGAGSSATPRIM